MDVRLLEAEESDGGGDVEVVVVQPTVERSHRSEFLDLFRGFIMLIMAWDHVTHQFTSAHDTVKAPGIEAWEGAFQLYDNNPKLFLARSVSHICAPGFFFTMGISMTLFALNRRTKHAWQWKQIFQHYLVRGAVLLLVEYVVNFPNSLPKLVDYARGREVRDWMAPPDAPGMRPKDILLHGAFGIYEVMTCLGLTTMIAPLALPVFFRAQQHASHSNNWIVLLLGWLGFVAVFLLSTLVIVSNQDLDGDGGSSTELFPHFSARCNNVIELAARYLFLPGALFKQWQMAVYPVFPWLGLTLLGQGVGFEVAKHGTIRHMPKYSLASLGGFALIRTFGGKLNFRGWGRGEDVGADSTLMAFFLQCKYPPDLCYALITLGVNMLLLWAFSKFANFFDYVAPVLLVFGRTPLFFYALHFWVIACAEAVFRVPSKPSGKFDLQYVLFVWLGVLVVLFFACRKYYAFKSTTSPTSLWRVF